jgi:hypothetical protein
VATVGPAGPPSADIIATGLHRHRKMGRTGTHSSISSWRR